MCRGNWWCWPCGNGGISNIINARELGQPRHSLVEVAQGLLHRVVGRFDVKPLRGVIQPGQHGAGLDAVTFSDQHLFNITRCAEIQGEGLWHDQVAIHRNADHQVAALNGDLPA